MSEANSAVKMGFIEKAGKGLSNLFDNCLKTTAGSSVLIVHGPDGFYEDEAVRAFEAEARARGLIIFTHSVPSIQCPEDIPPSLVKAMQMADYTVFFHTLGGMLRFISIPNAGTLCMTFAPSLSVLASDFCGFNHKLMQELMRLVQMKLDASSTWKITCPLGTELESPTVAPMSGGVTGDGFSLLQFPIGSHRPMLSHQMSGKLMIKWLMSTGVHRVEPFGIELQEAVCAHIEKGRIIQFTGRPDDVAIVSRRYDLMKKFNSTLDEGLVLNSWHAGIHPYGYCDTSAGTDFEKWITMAHHNPRMVHFHSCGDFNPGEIALPVMDPTISLDGVEYWKDGDFVFLKSNEVLDLMEKYTGQRAAPVQALEVGI